jgi:DNA-binding response OmpR family regulator
MSDEFVIPSPQAPEPGVILVVDDEPANRTLLHDLLTSEGHTVRLAVDADSARASFAEHPADVILLDVMMPGTSGIDLCREWKADPRLAAVPILLVTALSDREHRLEGIAAGANDFLGKPVDIVDLRLRVRNAVYTKHLHDRLLRRNEQLRALLAERGDG